MQRLPFIMVGLPLGLEAPVKTPNGVFFLFFSFLLIIMCAQASLRDTVPGSAAHAKSYITAEDVKANHHAMLLSPRAPSRLCSSRPGPADLRKPVHPSHQMLLQLQPCYLCVKVGKDFWVMGLED